MPPPDTDPKTGQHVHLPRLAEVVAGSVRESIISGELADGARLPRLEDMLDQFGVSVPSMREALRILEAEGLISVRRGAGGGAVVRRPNARTAAYAFALVLAAWDVDTDDVAEALTEFEPLCASFCARRKDRRSAVVPDLRAINEASRKALHGEDAEFSEHAGQFHSALVRRCGNASLTLVVGALQSIWLPDVRARMSARTEGHRAFLSIDERTASVDYHEQLTRLIAKGDDAEAYRLMREHLESRSDYGATSVPFGRVDPTAVRFGRPTATRPTQRS